METRVAICGICPHYPQYFQGAQVSDFTCPYCKLERAQKALRACNEHRNDPHAIVGIVDAALADMPPYPEYERASNSAEPQQAKP